MLISTFFFALMNALVKYLHHIPFYELILFRSLVAGSMAAFEIKRQGLSLLGVNKKYLFLRGLTGSFALLSFFYTLQTMPLASAVTVQYLSPIFTSFLAIFLLKERMRAIQWLFLLVAFGGVLMVKGFDTRVSFFELSMGICSALMAGFAYNFIRKLRTTDNPYVVVFYFPLIAIPVVAPLCVWEWVQPEGWDWLWLLLMGIFTQLGQINLTKSYQSAEVGTVSSLLYTGVIYALMIGWLWFEESFQWENFLGMAIIILGVLLNLWYVELNKKRQR